jgi:hypothetical protein
MPTERLLVVLAALAALVASVILLIDNRDSQALVTSVLFVGLVCAGGKP